MSNFEPIHGQCGCESVRFKVDSSAKAMYHCHCSLCRKLHGSFFATFAYLKADNFEITEGKGNLSYHDSGSLQWFFCHQCGSHLYATSNRWPDDLWYMPSVLNDGDVPGHPPETEKHIFVGSKSPSEIIHDNLPQYEEYAPPEQGVKLNP